MMIYEIQWLGWDLCEPLTYSISQGLFVIGTWYYAKKQMDSSYVEQTQTYLNNFRSKYYKRSGFNFDKMIFLEKDLKVVNEEIEQVEKEGRF
jgi:hypothetical protein